MAGTADSRTIGGVRVDATGVDWPKLPFRPALRMDWARVERFDVSGQVAGWEDGAGRRHARPAPDRELRRLLEEAWSEHLVARLADEGALLREYGRVRGSLASLWLTAGGLALLSVWLIAMSSCRAGLDATTRASALGVAALGLGLALLVAAVAHAHRELAAATVWRLDREGLHVRGRAGSWRLVLSSARESTRGPRHWRRDDPWLRHPRPFAGLGCVPLLLLVGWARRAGRPEPVVPGWDAAGHVRRIGRRLVLLWAPLFGVGVFVLQRLAGFTEPDPWLVGGGIAAGTVGLGAAFWWLGHRHRDHWEDVGRRADELLARLGW